MKVLVVFDEPYAGPASDAVWAEDSRANRIWFESNREKIDSGSAVFEAGMATEDVLSLIFEDHPDWSEIDIVGVPAPPGLEQVIGSDAALLARSTTGFTLERR